LGLGGGDYGEDDERWAVGAGVVAGAGAGASALFVWFRGKLWLRKEDHGLASSVDDEGFPLSMYVIAVTLHGDFASFWW
jgi:hypothetical protein